MLEAPLSTLGTTSGHCARPPGLDTHMPGRVVVGNQATSPGVPSRGLAAGRPPEISASRTGASWVCMGVGAPSTPCSSTRMSADSEMEGGESLGSHGLVPQENKYRSEEQDAMACT